MGSGSVTQTASLGVRGGDHRIDDLRHDLGGFAGGSLGIGYPGGSLLVLACVLLPLFVWWRAVGTVDVNSVSAWREESFYWLTITFSQTLGTALGDWSADSVSDGSWGLGYSGGALIFGAALAALAPRFSRRGSLASCCSGPRSS